MSKLNSICTNPFAEKMIKSHIDELKPFFFEFKVFEATFKRKLKLHKFEDEEKVNVARFYNKFEILHKSLKESKAYGKVIEFEFEQKICHELEHEKAKNILSCLELVDKLSGANSASPSSHKNIPEIKRREKLCNLNKVIKGKKYFSSDWCSQEQTKSSEYLKISDLKETAERKNDINGILTPQKQVKNFNIKIRNILNMNENRKLACKKVHKIILVRNEEEL